jgi:DNA-binding response OmpR family regulator
MEFSPQQIVRRVLVIDDDISIGPAIQAILARRCCETVIAPRAYEGIRALEQSTFDIVMVDLFMPGLSGLDAIKHIRSLSTMPIIAMSGFRLRSTLDSVDYLGRAARHGATLCIRKPFSSEQLVNSIEWTRNFMAKTERPKH